ncbi:hypothetical protein Ae201684P_014835 [Aphanomyces euteiches]|uniref:EGF-like domain-containing protein n=1 Tax=Aphanomyces euteiches TaxID=100861 RepID=A0A6G0WXP7_9STRA|nr:hypothetical protein Ae201684_010550 [Aphanomyces euteiches]KAH9090081.1 hypothetical protein Ae201684P_014835 [Aphanomyces euteiches]
MHRESVLVGLPLILHLCVLATSMSMEQGTYNSPERKLLPSSTDTPSTTNTTPTPTDKPNIPQTSSNGTWRGDNTTPPSTTAYTTSAPTPTTSLSAGAYSDSSSYNGTAPKYDKSACAKCRDTGDCNDAASGDPGTFCGNLRNTQIACCCPNDGWHCTTEVLIDRCLCEQLPPLPPTSRPHSSSSAIGLSVGCVVAAVLLVVVGIFWWRARQKKRLVASVHYPTMKEI